jgi:F-type H+-transporting ATPase subunit epsilon
LLGTLERGVFNYTTPTEGEGSGVISSGFFEVANDQVTVLAETLELKGEIDVARAKEAQKKAEAGLLEAGLDEHRFKKYQLKLQRAIVRQHFAGN